MQIITKVVAPEKFWENPWKTKKHPKNLRNPFQKSKKISQKPKKTPKTPKIQWKICFSAFGGQNLEGGGQKVAQVGGSLFWSTGGGGSVIASYSKKITAVDCKKLSCDCDIKS